MHIQQEEHQMNKYFTSTFQFSENTTSNLGCLSPYNMTPDPQGLTNSLEAKNENT